MLYLKKPKTQTGKINVDFLKISNIIIKNFKTGGAK